MTSEPSRRRMERMPHPGAVLAANDHGDFPSMLRVMLALDANRAFHCSLALRPALASNCPLLAETVKEAA
jgi:hypothetical protein